MQIGIVDLHNFLFDNGGLAVALQAQSGGCLDFGYVEGEKAVGACAMHSSICCCNAVLSLAER